MNSLAPLPRAVADAAPEVLGVSGLGKSFVLHLRGGMELPVVSGAAFSVRAGTCVALGGPSGAGKSSILKMVFGNYRIDRGRHPDPRRRRDGGHGHRLPPPPSCACGASASAMSASSCASSPGSQRWTW